MTLRRVVVAGQVAAGALALGRPQRVAREVAGRGTPPPLWTVRLLGVRMIVQGAAIGLSAAEGALGVGAAVDALHGMSMVAVAGVSARYHGAAVRAAMAALVFAGLEMAARR